MGEIRKHARVLTAALVGTSVEFYDFYIYATAAALIFGKMFFPASSPEAQTLYAFMTFGVAFVARPIGAIAFGHYGDRIGRKSTLVASLMLMGASTALIAFLPSYAMAGWIAPALLCVLRFGQGFGLGGEWGGAALLAVENAPSGWENRFGSAPQMGAPIGFLAANGLFLLLGLVLSESQFVAWGWRIPFLASVVLVAIGLWVRRRIGETPAFAAALKREPPVAIPIANLFRHYPRAVLAGSAGVIACFAIFYLSTAFALAQGTTVLGYSREAFLSVQLGANCFLAIGVIVAATLADRTSPRRVMMLGALATVALGFLFGPGLLSGSLGGVFATLSLAMFTMGFVYGPVGGWLPTLFPVSVRYSGVSMAFNLGGIVGGGVTPLIAQKMASSGHGGQAGLLLSVAGLLTLLGLILARPSGQGGQAAPA